MEATQFITPIQSLTLGSDGITTTNTTAADSVGSVFSDFKNLFTDALESAEAAERDLEDKEYLLTTGQIDDAHTVPIAAAEAQLSIDLLVAIRNKAIDAYNELMRISM